MNPPPLMYRDPRMIDTDHLKLLSIFHFVGAGLAVLGLLFVFVHFTIMRTVFMNPQFLQSTHQPAPPMPPAEIIGIMKWFYLAAALWMIASAALNPRPSGTAVYNAMAAVAARKIPRSLTAWTESNPYARWCGTRGWLSQSVTGTRFGFLVFERLNSLLNVAFL